MRGMWATRITGLVLSLLVTYYLGVPGPLWLIYALIVGFMFALIGLCLSLL